MAYTTRGGIFAGLDDTDPVLRGRYNLRGVDDQRGVYDLSGLDDTDPVLRRSLRGLDDTDPVLKKALRGLGEVPPGTSERDKREARKSFYYLYCLAAMDPIFRRTTNVAAGVSVATLLVGILTGGLATLGVGAAAAIAIASVENCIMETTLWWKRSKRDRDNYIRGAMIGDDVKEVLRRAARRLDDVTQGIQDPLRRQRARARAYFQDFIAVGQRSALKSLSPDQQGAFGEAYLRAIAAGKKEQVALDEGTQASNRVKQAADNAAKMQRVQQAREQAAARRREATQRAQDAAKRAADMQTKLNAAKSKIALARTPSDVAKAQQDAAAAAAAAAKAAEDAKMAEQVVAVTVTEEKKVEDTAKIVKKEADVLQPTPTEQKEAEANDSAEDKAADKTAQIEDKAKGTETTPNAAAAKGGGGGLLPIVGAAAALALGAPALPVVGAAAALAFLMRKK